jgi:Vacuolar protein sorting-associated protein 62
MEQSQPPERRSVADQVKGHARLLGVLAVVGLADLAGAVTSIFAPDQEPARCEAAAPAAVLVDPSTPALPDDPVPKYAPLVHIDRRDVHVPMPADCFLEHASLSWARLSARNDAQLEPVSEIDSARLGGADGGYEFDEEGVFRSHEFTRPFAKNRARSLDGRRGFYLDVEDEFRFGAESSSTEQGVFAGSPVYYEFAPGHYITYWFFYGFSAPAGTKAAVAKNVGHEGDWERVTVRLSGKTATDIAYYQHGGAPQELRYAAVAKRGTHPIVFSGRGSHASYSKAGLQTKFLDRTGRGREWRTWEFLADATKQPWFGYGGAWGVVRLVPKELQKLKLGPGEFTGPSGPCSKKPAPDGWLLDPKVPPPGPGVCAPR